MKNPLLFMALGVLLITGTLLTTVVIFDTDEDPVPIAGEPPGDGDTRMKQFASFEEMEDFIERNQRLKGYDHYSNLSSYPNSHPVDGISESDDTEAGPSDVNPDPGSRDHSTTNVQETGVDEGDILKNDDTYAYLVTSDRRSVQILKAYPARSMDIITEIETDGYIEEIYLSGDKLSIIEDGDSLTISVYDISHPDDPELDRKDEVEGSMVSSRLIGGYLYVIAQDHIFGMDNEEDLPTSAINISYTDVYDIGYTITHIVCMDVFSDAPISGRFMLVGWSSEVYVSGNNIYLTQLRYQSWAERKEMELEEAVIPLMEEEQGDKLREILDSDDFLANRIDEADSLLGRYMVNMTDEQKRDFRQQWRDNYYQMEYDYEERTVINRIAVRNGEVYLKATGEVPGYALNRYSMSEYDDHFRIATTSGRWRYPVNQLYILDMDLKITGNITGIAPGESIYSARFMGERAYLVTFEKIDPFFVIDVSDPTLPKILGELKIPGYSDYLHPFGEDLVIGLGKDTVMADEGDFSWYQGVKISLFDVSDLENPRERSKFIIGDRGTYSPAQHDPHAFLFSPSKNLLVIPISLHEVWQGAPAYERGDFREQSFYVFGIDEDGIDFKGSIRHSDEYEWYSMFRSFYIGDVLYTISSEKVIASDISDLSRISYLELPGFEEENYWYYD